MIGRFSHQPLDPMLGAMVIKAADTSGFANAVLTAANRLNGAVEVFAYRAGENGRPQALFSASLSQSFVERSERYAGGFYRDDPVAHARHNLAQGSGFTRQVTATEILRGDYREICFDRPGFVDKLCIGWRGPTQTIVLSFYHKVEDDGQALQRLAGLADLTLACLMHDLETTSTVTLITRIETKLLRSFPNLSLRERQVSARTIAGWTALKTATSLGIRLGTVLTYRQRAYQRLGFTHAADFLEGILD